ncbi:unannotated protein [freshwater metagenome]|uniref:Unannotated protein n=1 Tax=freshwater metagenome TaxID=449393 RepID=A0A6J7ANC4_9ZZZZ
MRGVSFNCFPLPPFAVVNPMRLPDVSRRLYMNPTPPAEIATYVYGRAAACEISSSWNGMSDTPKSTEPWMYCWRPNVEPDDT